MASPLEIVKTYKNQPAKLYIPPIFGGIPGNLYFETEKKQGNCLKKTVENGL